MSSPQPFTTDSTPLDSDTITAVATAPGKGGVGIVRVSGPKAREITEAIVRKPLPPRQAHFGPFVDAQGETLDEGLALFFAGPHSFTGEDVLELQGHGGPVILDCLLQRVTELGARLARPGEFSERAFLNDKLDLAQAEAIADLIDASSTQAARNAIHSLQGVFSDKVDSLVEMLIQLRIYVEAAIDFPEEEIDFIGDGKVAADLALIIDQLESVLKEAQQGAILREGMQVVIAGKPNAGKSSLLNALAGRESAIVTDIAGTTRDILREHIHIDGMPLHIIDTAGLRDSPDTVERIGIERAWAEIEKADRILLVVDSTDHVASSLDELWPESISRQLDPARITLVYNKIDLSDFEEGLQPVSGQEAQVSVGISAKSQRGIEVLRQHLKTCIGFSGSTEGGFTARRRHLDALERARKAVLTGQQQLQELGAGELLAEDLRAAQQALGEITGSFTPDDLLGRIFSSFCIGK